MLFASGMAAVAAVLMDGAREGDLVVVPSDGYPGVRTIAVEQLRPRGIEVRVVATDEDAVRAAPCPARRSSGSRRPQTPASTSSTSRALAADAHAAGAILAVDNTLATPLSQRPLELGADLSVASASKMPERALGSRARLRRDVAMPTAPQALRTGAV